MVSHELCDVVLVNCAAPSGTAPVASRRVQLTELKHRCGVSFSVYSAFDFPGTMPEMKKTQACRHQRVEFARWADVAIIGSFLSGLRHHYLSTIAGTSLVSTVWLVGVARFYLLLGLAVRGWYKWCTRSVWPNPERCQWTAVLSAGCHKLWL